MEATKTTLYLPDSLRMRLKTVAARQRKTVTQIIAEGGEMVIGRYEGAEDREEVQRRAVAARERLRAGLYAGPPASVDADRLVYGG